MPGSLIATKLFVPKLRAGVVDRSRLSERLQRGGAAKLTLVSAPAGFGKTTAVVAWLQSRPGGAVAWLSLDESDDQPAVFWAHVIAALEGAVARSGAAPLGIPEPAGQPDDRIPAAIINALASLPQSLELVLDDYHVVEQPPVHTGVSERELDVLRLLGSDLGGPQIARELGISENTMRTHTKNIYEKLGVNEAGTKPPRVPAPGLCLIQPTREEPEMTLSMSMPAQTTPRTMRAAVFDRFGGPEVVRLAEIAVPQPGPHDILIRVAASTVSAADHRMRARDLPKGLGLLALPVVGLVRPRRQVLGMDLAGTVEAIGAAVTRFEPGDEVVGITGSAFGGHAEYVVLPEAAAIVMKPQDLSPEDAVALAFGGHTISECIRQCAIRPGDEVLVNGAAGAVGSAAVQVAKSFGARVTAVTSAGNAELVRRLGADRIIDYRTEDFALGDETYDVIFECVGNAPFERVDRVLKPGGALLQVIVDLKALLGAKGHSRRSGKRVIPISFTPTAEDMEFAVRLYREGGLGPVLDRTYSFDEIVEAHRYVDTGHKRGSVVLKILNSGSSYQRAKSRRSRAVPPTQD